MAGRRWLIASDRKSSVVVRTDYEMPRYRIDRLSKHLCTNTYLDSVGKYLLNSSNGHNYLQYDRRSSLLFTL